MPINNGFKEFLEAQGIPEHTAQKASDSGYYLRGWVNPGTAKTYTTVSDLMYGNKQFSSSFETEEFLKYLQGGKDVFEPLPPFREIVVRNRSELLDILEDSGRRRYIADGSLSLRGQTGEYRFRREIPNPRRADPEGFELCVMPGLYRQNPPTYSFATETPDRLSLRLFLNELEPSNDNVYADSEFAYDMVRVEQHYATPTGGLDLSFDIDTALFFATHKFTRSNGIATYEPIPAGSHAGVIYCFRFGAPTVKKSEYLIRDFDLFKAYRPERILRQACALPMIGDFERNIAITEIDCVIRLHRHFEDHGLLTPEHMFPNIREDKFYGQLLSLKERFPKELETIVEYAWARG